MSNFLPINFLHCFDDSFINRIFGFGLWAIDIVPPFTNESLLIKNSSIGTQKGTFSPSRFTNMINLTISLSISVISRIQLGITIKFSFRYCIKIWIIFTSNSIYIVWWIILSVVKIFVSTRFWILPLLRNCEDVALLSLNANLINEWLRTGKWHETANEWRGSKSYLSSLLQVTGKLRQSSNSFSIYYILATISVLHS